MEGVMKALVIVGLGIALGACAVPPAETVTLSVGPLLGTSSSAFTPVSAQGTERPQEIVGTENHRAVLDGAS
jgi:hypothetical protein